MCALSWMDDASFASIAAMILYVSIYVCVHIQYKTATLMHEIYYFLEQMFGITMKSNGRLVSIKLS